MTRRGTSLVEVLLVCMLLAGLGGYVAFTGGDFAERYAGSRGEIEVEAAVRDVARWLRRACEQAISQRRDFTMWILSYSGPTKQVRARFRTPNEDVYLRTDMIAFRVEMAANGNRPDTFTYSSRWQRMAPAFTLNMYVVEEDGRMVRTKWSIIVSGKGRVRVSDGA